MVSRFRFPYLVALKHDRRKPSDRVLEQLATALKTDSDILYHLAGRIPPDLTPRVVSEDRLAAAWRAFRRELGGDGKSAAGEERRAMIAATEPWIARRAGSWCPRGSRAMEGPGQIGAAA